MPPEGHGKLNWEGSTVAVEASGRLVLRVAIDGTDPVWRSLLVTRIEELQSGLPEGREPPRPTATGDGIELPGIERQAREPDAEGILREEAEGIVEVVNRRYEAQAAAAEERAEAERELRLEREQLAEQIAERVRHFT